MEQVLEATKGNKYAHTVADGFATFLFAPKATTNGLGTHIKDGMDLKRLMIFVVLAMQVCLLFGMYNVGHQHFLAYGLADQAGFFTKFFYGLFQVLPIVVVAYGVGLGIEFFFAARKGHSIEEGYLVSGMLIPLIMPPDIPLWMVAVATIFAVIIGKEAFGGTGMNILNIALTARVFIFFAYPTTISGDEVWVAYDYNFLHSIFGLDGLVYSTFGADAIANAKYGLQSFVQADGWTGATPLALAAKGGWEAVQSTYTSAQMFWGDIPGSIGETSKWAVLIGGAFLLATGIASWRIMASMLVGAIVTGLLFNAFGAADSFLGVPFHYHLIMGSFLFAMVFMATDPVTAAQTDTGKLIYGFMIGVVGMIVRVLNPAYPEGWMLAILFMNVFAPLIDHYVVAANIKRRLARANAN